MSLTPKEQSTTQARPKANGWLTSCGMIIVPCIVLACTLWQKVSSLSGSNTSPNGISELSMAGSLSSAQGFVKDELKAPSTAKFSPIEEEKAEAIGPKQVRVTGWVDAQNSFGSMLRSKWMVEQKLSSTDSGGDTWQAKSVHIDLDDIQRDH